MNPRKRISRTWAVYVLATAALGATALLGACSGDSITGPAAEACGPAPYLTVLPVPAASLSSIAIFGGVDAPGHTLPTDHGGLFLSVSSATLRSPGDMTVTELRRVRSTEDGVPGVSEDYAIFFQVCRELTGWFGHVIELGSRFSPESVDYADCQTYSTPFAEYEACTARNLSVRVSAGDVIGTAGPVTDMGMVDQRVTNFYVSPHRFGGPNHAVCMWDQFDAATQTILYSKLRDLRRPSIVPGGEPRCGTMEVDVAGTAKGVWADPSLTGPIQADEQDYMALVDYPYRPQDDLALSLGPATLGARLAFVDRRTSGRVNRAFEDVTPDGQIYCYGPDVESFRASWLLGMTTPTELRMEYVQHALDASPCEADPSTWSFSGNAVTMVR
jgi:hypothetical protein